MICALISAVITLVFPLCTRYITKNVLEGNLADALDRIYQVGAFMLLLVTVQAACNFVVDYRGHGMGAMMESDLRSELFEHYQKLSFRFYDEQKTGQLMSRITNDLFSLTELYHHAPEDIVIYTVKFIGAFAILIHINVRLTLAVFLLLPILAVYSFYFDAAHYDCGGCLRRSRYRQGIFRFGGFDHIFTLYRVSDRAHPTISSYCDAIPGRNNRVRTVYGNYRGGARNPRLSKCD